MSFGTVIHASVPTARYTSVKEPLVGSVPPHASVASVLPTSFTSKPVGASAGSTRTDAWLLTTGVPTTDPLTVYVTVQRTKPLVITEDVTLLPVWPSITFHASEALGSESSARFSHTYVSSPLFTIPSRFVVAFTVACAPGATAWSLGSTSTDSSFKAGCSDAVTNRLEDDGNDSTSFCTACTRHS